MRRAICFIGVIAALGIMLVSASMNARYSMSLGASATDRALLAGGAVFADIGKALAWVFLAAAVMRRELLQAIVALTIFVPCLGIAVSGSFGFVAAQRATTMAEHGLRHDMQAAIQNELRLKLARREAIGAVEDPAVARGRLDIARQNVLHARTKQCSEATEPHSRTFCAGLKRIETDIARASEAVRLDSEIARTGPSRSVIPIDPDQRFQAIPIKRSDRSRSAVPGDPDQGGHGCGERGEA